MHNAEDPWFRSPDALVLAAPMGVSLLAAALGILVQVLAAPRVDPFLRDVLVFGYGTLGPPAVGLIALSLGRGAPRGAGLGARGGKGSMLGSALSALLMVPGYWAVVLGVCAVFALDFPQIGALGLLASYAAFCSFAAWLRLRPRPPLQQGLAAALLLAVAAAGAIPEASLPLEREPLPLLPLGRSGPAPAPPRPVEEAAPDPLPPVGSTPVPPAPAAPPLGVPRPDSDRTRPPRPPRLEDRIQRQLARNGLSRVDIRVEPDAVVATGFVGSSEEQLRLRLVVESLAPHLAYLDLTRVAAPR